MFKNYLLIAFRNLVKYKSFSAINILGMGISLASVILISLYIWDEWQFDRYHPEGERVFRIYSIMSSPESGERYAAMVQPALATKLQEEFPEVEQTARILGTISEKQVQLEEKLFSETRGAHGEGQLFDIMAISILDGDPNQILTKPNAVAISESLAGKYFGSDNPIGQTLKIDGTDHEVTHVYANFPSHSHLQLDFLISMESLTWLPERIDSWTWHQMYTYFKLREGTDSRDLEKKVQAYAEKESAPFNSDSGFKSVPYFQNLHDIHLKSSNFQYDLAIIGNKDTVHILMVAAGMILLISCFNFINLSTARAVKRMKEVGVRKVIGAQKSNLQIQFLLESYAFTFFGLMLAILLASLSIPLLADLTGKELSLPLSMASVILLIATLLVLGILAGAYPAFLLSSFKPITVISGAKEMQGGHGTFRKAMVILQFVLSFFLIIGAWIVVEQNNLLKNKDMGFDKDTLMSVYGRGVKASQLESIKTEILNRTGIKHATWSYGIPGDIFAQDGVINPTTGERMSTIMFVVDYDYIQTFGMELLAGRDFSRDYGTDPQKAFILNETATKNFGFGTPEDALGKNLYWDMWTADSVKQGEVIGVVKDFHANSLKEAITPLVMHIQSEIYYTLTMRLDKNMATAQISEVEKIFNDQVPGQLFSYSFVDDNFNKMYRSEQNLSILLNIFAGLTILVACMGLFGLVEYHVHQRAKEISIRKVFGARTDSILLVLTKQYFVMIMIAFAIAVPLVWYTSGGWLANFAYRIEITPFLFLKAALLVGLITLITVSYQSIKAALGNPAEILKGN
ncbi:ABC transporter permease [Litoribacter alkaliphilus]|uniref:ABC transporter permease n=1 Tax=Litoribacter ruber TaxID=702568 RepID=A0AAP2CJA5_9BACT|nr:ABC transporter permease [Litoribacter alkaliphilus]MBS9525753.1 ABC transporter permease [Litoribacter alkaliphilus]